MAEINQRESQKKLWVTPQLTVVVRGRPEEAILTHCKQNNDAGGVVPGWDQCQSNDGCSACNEYGQT